MALKTKELTIEKGRDAGVRFIITEMPVVKADKWATKVLITLMNAGVEVPDVSMGMLGVTTMLLSSLQNVDADKAIPLMDELLDCVQIIPEGGSPRKLDLSLNDVQDFTTLWVLRKEALMLHLDFLQLANTQISA